jgi:hypothetical protein
MMKRFPVLLLLGSLLLPACGKAPQYENAAGEVADRRRMPQSLSVLAERYAGPDGQRGADALLRSHAEAEADAEHFRRMFFQPWNEGAHLPNLYAIQDSLAELERVPEKRGYAGNLRPWTDMAWQALRLNADLPGLERALHRPEPKAAITVRATHLRAAPTEEPRFDKVHGAGKGWPFDLFQQTALPVGMPLSVLHQSRDGAWLYAESSGVWGWVRAEDAAFAGPGFQRQWQSTPLAVVVRDGVGLRFRRLGAGEASARTLPVIAAGAFLGKAGIGTVLPSPRAGEVLLPQRGLDGKAYAVTAACQAPASGTAAYGQDDASAPLALIPMSLTPQNVARIGDRMMGQPYGWGGLNGGRDCSAMMRDLFAPFGIWLPRNSARQAESGARVSLDALRPEMKEQRLLSSAQPFRTLVWMPGHIGLYVGQWQGRAAFFHNMWGVRTRLDDGREGRAIVGRAVTTSLRPGAERTDVDEERLLIERVGAFTVIGGNVSEK